MKTYADTSFFFSLYATDSHSSRADAWRQSHPDPLPFTGIHRLELRNALSLAVFQQRLTPQEVQAAWQEVENDLASGLLVPRVGLWHRILGEAESLARQHTPTVGCRSLDILHVAIARTLATTVFCTLDYTVLRPTADFESRYFEAFYRTPVCRVELYRRAKGIVEGFWRLYTDDFYDIRVPVPDPVEQAAMVRFLDYANGRLERAIRAKRKVIALLHEQKQAIIHRAVTRGLDPTVPLKPSGIPWLGDIPKHWEVRRLRFCTRGKLTYGANAAAEFDNPDWPRYLRITDFKGDGSLRPDTFRSLPPEVAKDYLVEDGDILFARSGATVGKAFLVRTDTVKACYAGYLIRARPNTDVVLPTFLFAFTQSTAFVRWKDAIFNRATIQNIGADKYANLAVPIPPIAEQQAILDFVETELAPIRTANSRIEREIELLREYRTRLVADVVTGKLDVRQAARQLPAETVEPAAALETEELTEPEPEETSDANE